MKFTKKIQGYNLKFEMISGENDSDVVVEVTIPPYNSRKNSRGCVYNNEELHEIIMETFENKLVPEFLPAVMGRAKAKKDESRKLIFKYNKKKTRVKKTTAQPKSETVVKEQSVVAPPSPPEKVPVVKTPTSTKRTAKPRTSSKKISSKKTSK